MDNTRLFGVAIGLVILGYAALNWSRRSRGESLLTMLIGLAIVILSVDPAAANVIADTLSLRNRLFAVLVVSNILLFMLFLVTFRRGNKTQRDLSQLVRMIARTEYVRNHDRGEGANKIMIVMPAYREEESIRDVLATLPKTMLGFEIEPIVVVDGNYDNTERVVKSMGYRVATQVTNRGQGSALITGFDIAILEGCHIVVTMDADGQHRVEDLPTLLQPIIDNTADYVMGSRFAGEYEDEGGARHLGIVIFSNLISLLAQTKITDCTNGYRAIRTEKLARMTLIEDRFNAPELILQAARQGLRIKEVPVNILSRAVGESKKPRRLGYPLRFGYAMIRAWLR